MPSAAHEFAHTFWNSSLSVALLALTGGNDHAVLGCVPLGATSKSHVLSDPTSAALSFPAFTLSNARKKQADSCICPVDSDSPTVVVEVGDSETLKQLQTDVRLWLESDLLNVRQNSFCQ